LRDNLGINCEYFDFLSWKWWNCWKIFKFGEYVEKYSNLVNKLKNIQICSEYVESGEKFCW